MNKFTVSVLVVLASTIFGLVFIKQIRVSQREMAEIFSHETVAGTSVNMADPADTSEKIERSLNSLNLDKLDETSAQIEVQMQGL